MEAIRSVTHLVLALAGLPFLFLKAFLEWNVATPLPRPSHQSGTRKRSVPVRVSLSFKSLF